VGAVFDLFCCIIAHRFDCYARVPVFTMLDILGAKPII
jgi:hypothetical protein